MRKNRCAWGTATILSINTSFNSLKKTYPPTCMNAIKTIQPASIRILQTLLRKMLAINDKYDYVLRPVAPRGRSKRTSPHSRANPMGR